MFRKPVLGLYASQSTFGQLRRFVRVNSSKKVSALYDYRVDSFNGHSATVAAASTSERASKLLSLAAAHGTPFSAMPTRNRSDIHSALLALDAC